MRLGDLDALKEDLFIKFGNQLPNGLLDAIDNAQTVELDESVVQEVLNKRGMTAVANESLVALHGKRPQGEIKKYKPFELDHNVQCAVENLKTAYWSNDSEKMAPVYVEASEMIMSAICHYGYTVCKPTKKEGAEG